MCDWEATLDLHHSSDTSERSHWRLEHFTNLATYYTQQNIQFRSTPNINLTTPKQLRPRISHPNCSSHQDKTHEDVVHCECDWLSFKSPLFLNEYSRRQLNNKPIKHHTHMKRWMKYSTLTLSLVMKWLPLGVKHWTRRTNHLLTNTNHYFVAMLECSGKVKGRSKGWIPARNEISQLGEKVCDIDNSNTLCIIGCLSNTRS